MRAAATLLAIAVVALVGCGVDEGDVVKREPAVADPGTNPELGASPGRTALAWWETLRARDVEAVVSRLTPAARLAINQDKLRRSMRLGFGQFAEGSQAHVLYTERDLQGTTVYMRIDGGALVGSRLIKGGSIYLALPFVQQDGAWLIENGAWLRRQANNYIAIRRFNQKIRRQALRNQAREESENGD
jgi:hypothetical protein